MKAETHFRCTLRSIQNEKDSEWKRLANWVSFQRLQYKKLKKGDKTTLMTEERRQELADLGFVFSVKDDNPRSNWNNMLDELYRYKSTHANSCDVPSDYEGNRRLAAWVRYLRKLYADRQGGDADAALELNDDRIRVCPSGDAIHSRHPFETHLSQITDTRHRQMRTVHVTCGCSIHAFAPPGPAAPASSCGVALWKFL